MCDDGEHTCTITYEDSCVTWPELLPVFLNFLRGCGFVIGEFDELYLQSPDDHVISPNTSTDD
jgi:hypothetical protein